MQMRGVVVRGPGAPVAVEEIELDPPGPGEVLVRVIASGVCHSDLHCAKGAVGSEFPYLFGHEATAIGEEMGDGVSRPAGRSLVVHNLLGTRGSLPLRQLLQSPHRRASPA